MYVLATTLRDCRILSDAKSGVSMLRNAAWALSNLCRGKTLPADFEEVPKSLPTLARLIFQQFLAEHQQSEVVEVDNTADQGPPPPAPGIEPAPLQQQVWQRSPFIPLSSSSNRPHF